MLLTSCSKDECECDKNHFIDGNLVAQEDFELKSSHGQFQIMGDNVFFGRHHYCNTSNAEAPYQRHDTLVNGTDTTVILRELKYSCHLR